MSTIPGIMTREEYVQQVTSLVCALIASGQYKKIEWHERNEDCEFDGIDSDGNHISFVGLAGGLLRDIHASFNEANPLRADPPGGFYDPGGQVVEAFVVNKS